MAPARPVLDPQKWFESNRAYQVLRRTPQGLACGQSVAPPVTPRIGTDMKSMPFNARLFFEVVC